MDTLAIILVTAFINIVVSSIVSNLIFYRYQKKIDDLYNKQMEEFRKRLEYVNYEKQIKFTKNYERTVETLDILYKKFVDFSVGFSYILRKIEIHENIYKINFHEYKLNSQKLEEFKQCFLKNRQYIPSEVQDGIKEIYFAASVLHLLMALLFNNATILTPEHFEYANNYIQRFAEIDTINARKPEYSKIIVQMDKEMNGLSEKLETLYKSVAEVSTENEIIN
jgi:hypothetical protein